MRRGGLLASDRYHGRPCSCQLALQLEKLTRAAKRSQSVSFGQRINVSLDRCVCGSSRAISYDVRKPLMHDPNSLKSILFEEEVALTPEMRSKTEYFGRILKGD